MTALLRAELGRALSRRLFLVLGILLLAGIVVGGIATYFTSPAQVPDGPPRNFRKQQIERCIERGEPRRICRFTTLSTSDPGFRLKGLPDTFLGTSLVLVVAAWLVGASFIGAEWHTGNITTVLTWEPRRLRLLIAKLCACLIVVSVVALVLHVLLALALLPAAAFRGSTSGFDLGETSAVVLRVIALADIGAVLGFALAAIGRNTAAALGAGFAYIAIVENVVRAWKPNWSRWLITDNAIFFVSGDPPIFEFGDRGVTGAGALLAAYALGLFVLAAALFRARDVT